MDREIEEVINILNKQVGKDKYILFLTSDHGGSDNPLFLNSKRLPGNFYSPKEIKKKLNIYLSKEFSPKKYISYFNKTQIYLNPKIENKIEVLKKIKQFLQKIDGIKKIYIPALNSKSINDDVFVNSYNPEVSGDILYEMYSGWMVERKFGTTHASSYNNDSHVPLIWYGKNINKGETSLPVKITQIVPTISMLLNIPLPNVSNKNPIVALISNNYAITKKE
jgi:arylsulfatase A-like enzyme